MMPEKEPTDDSEDYVDTEECVAFPLDHFDNLARVVLIKSVKDGLLDNSLKELARVPECCDSPKDFLLEPVMKDNNADKGDACFEK